MLTYWNSAVINKKRIGLNTYLIISSFFLYFQASPMSTISGSWHFAKVCSNSALFRTPNQFWPPTAYSSAKSNKIGFDWENCRFIDFRWLRKKIIRGATKGPVQKSVCAEAGRKQGQQLRNIFVRFRIQRGEKIASEWKMTFVRFWAGAWPIIWEGRKDKSRNFIENSIGCIKADPN